jgi:hypothetical protein
MKILALASLLISLPLSNCFAQKVKLEWKVADSITYTTCFDEVTKSFPDSVKLNTEADSTGRLLFNTMKELNKQFLDASFQSRIRRNTKKDYLISISMKGRSVSKSIADKHGVPTDKIPDQEKNFYLFFFKMPDKKVKVGDEWKLGIHIPKNISSMQVSDSVKYDRVTLTKIEKTEKGRIAVLSYSYLEEYKGSWMNPDTKTNEPALVSFRYTAEGRFNIDHGRWEELDGLMDLVFRGAMEGRSIRHTCMRY